MLLETLRMFVTGKPPYCAGPGMPQRARASSRPPSALRTMGAIPSVTVQASLGLATFAELPAEAQIGDCRPRAYLSDFAARQPYAFVFFGEKSSLEPVLAPLARMYQADLYLAAGELSDTLV
jgi:hypothetical protein